MVLFWIAALIAPWSHASNPAPSTSTKSVVEWIQEKDPILKAIDQDQVHRVRHWIRQGHSPWTVRIRNHPEETLFDRAASRGSEKVFQLFLSQEKTAHGKTNKVLRDARGTPLLLSLVSLANPARQGSHKYERMILIFLNEHPDQINAHDLAYIGDGRTALHQAAANGNVEVLKTLVAQGAEVDVLDANFETPLHYAARFGQLEALKTLISHGANTNSISKHTRITPLLAAAENGHEPIIRKLLHSGAKKSLKDAFGKTAPQRYREFVANYYQKISKVSN